MMWIWAYKLIFAYIHFLYYTVQYVHLVQNMLDVAEINLVANFKWKYALFAY